MRSPLLAALALLAALPARQDGFEWRNDLEAARRDAAKDGKPLLLVFR